MKFKCVIERWNFKKKLKPKSLQFLIEALTKLGSFVDAYASTCDLKKKIQLWILNTEYNIYVVCIAHAFIHACWCSSATSSHLRDSTIYNVMLAPLCNTLSSPHNGGSMAKMVSLANNEEPIQKVFTKSGWST